MPVPSYTWNVDADGDWSTPGDWSPAGPPSSGSDVTIDTTDLHTITFGASSGFLSIDSLTVGDDILELTGGSLTVASGASIGNGLRIDGAGTYDVAGDDGIAAGGNGSPLLTNLGTLAKTAGSGISHVAVDVADDGTISVASGNLRFDGASNSFEGTYIGPGMIDYGFGSTDTLWYVDMVDGACSTNFGTVNQIRPVTMSTTTTITNVATATWDLADDVSLALAAPGGSPLFTNHGLFDKTGGFGISTVAAPFTSDGEIVVLSGSIEFTGGFTNTGIVGGVLSQSGGVTTITANTGPVTYEGTEAGFAGKALAFLYFGDELIFTDASLASFAYTWTSTTLNYGSGDHLTLYKDPFVGHFSVSADPTSGVDLTLAR
ncbi:MAG: hypothetical protein JOZ58_28500, partial [Acetobacteraceae bacterium]|nr:hypothetical protein [Acetobacteraceae bacterium]